MKRCAWATTPQMQAYHDDEWGVPVHDDDALFEFLTLEGAQAGLSWATILNKRERYRALFDDFSIARVAGFTPARITRLLGDPGIVRNRAKVESAVSNARASVKVQREWGSFDAFVWSFTNGETMRRKPRARTPDEVPTTSAQSVAMSAALRERGFRFVGPTICYAFMQAVGIVDDHLAECGIARRAS